MSENEFILCNPEFQHSSLKGVLDGACSGICALFSRADVFFKAEEFAGLYEFSDTIRREPF